MARLAFADECLALPEAELVRGPGDGRDRALGQALEQRHLTQDTDTCRLFGCRLELARAGLAALPLSEQDERADPFAELPVDPPERVEALLVGAFDRGRVVVVPVQRVGDPREHRAGL